MSTTDDYNVAKSLAASRCGLIFVYHTRSLSKGVEIADFSMYPKERKLLYPLRTYLLLDERESFRRLEDGTMVVPFIPQMA